MECRLVLYGVRRRVHRITNAEILRCGMVKGGGVLRVEVINQLKKEKGYTNEELARLSGVPKATLDKITSGKTASPNFDTMEAIAGALGCSLDVFRKSGSALTMKKAPDISSEAMGMAKSFDRLDLHGKRILHVLMEEELSRLELEPGERARAAADEPAAKIIPLYFTPAAAGYASPAMGTDYTDYKVDLHSPADFAARIQGDSMEPYIQDNSIVLVKRQKSLQNGEVGLFFVDGDMKCKQYCEDSFGNIHLFSLNRSRADADVTVSASSGVTVLCYGKVILSKRPPLPKM